MGKWILESVSTKLFNKQDLPTLCILNLKRLKKKSPQKDNKLIIKKFQKMKLKKTIAKLVLAEVKVVEIVQSPKTKYKVRLKSSKKIIRNSYQSNIKTSLCRNRMRKYNKLKRV
jgi:hypothetical protein